ncbi:protein Dok-7 isoform X3 [Myripristis murdjan]|uniref:protein Dok-7 isoform X3 n=1 Tax=Myripristis murdjan TaxID=586833 RepID=UPI001175EB2B|nr:protein Dok-7-like isoform X3 [Myripristis murdjan]
MTDTVVAEGQVKFRDGKKWKTRWVVLRKPSPVADCLSLLVYKEKKKGREKGRGHKERLNVTLEGICGVEPGPGYDGVAYTLSILCLGHTLVLGFHSREALLAWDTRLRYSLGEVHRFSVNVQPGTKLESGPASLHLCNNLLVLTRDFPPAVIGHWKLSELRRYGAVPNGFVFEGGTRCGYWAGVFFLSCSEGEQISFLFDCIVRGISPSRAPHGLRPALPADPTVHPSSSEERINLEASELERRLSMLSHCSRPSSTASTYSYSTSVAGDDHSSISSSSSSQSDASYGSRLPLWAESTARPHLSTETLSGSSAQKSLTSSEDRLHAAVTGGSGIYPSSKQVLPRGLHDSGRQSSLDSGIGIATGSQSSYSGSFSSYTGSLDTASQGGGEEFGSLVSLPPSAPPPPPSSPPPSIAIPEHHCITPTSSCPSRPSSSASNMSYRHSEEYQIPSLLKLRYDTPRSLLHSLRELSAQGGAPELGKDRRSSGGDGGDQGQEVSDSPTGTSPQQLRAQHQSNMQRSHSWGSERAPSVDSLGRCTPRPFLLPACPICGGTQCSHGSDNYITPEQWRSARMRGLTQVDNSSPLGLSASANTPDTVLRLRDEQDDAGGFGNGMAALQRSEPCLLPPPTHMQRLHRPASVPDSRSSYEQKDLPKMGDLRLDEHRMFQFPEEALSLDTRLRIDSSANYVNIPISPLAAKASRELLYMELDLQEPSSASVPRPPSAVREEGSSRYAHLDITAMETAQKVGAEHAQGREDRLTQLENRRRGPPN